MTKLKEHPEHPGYLQARADIADEYIGGVLIISKDHPDFIIEEFVGDPGSDYGPYIIGRSIEGPWSVPIDLMNRKCGIVGQRATIEEAKECLKVLAEMNVMPLPTILKDENGDKKISIESKEGYRIEAEVVQYEHCGQYTFAIDCEIFSQEGAKIGLISFSSFQKLVDLRDSPEYMASCLVEIEKDKQFWAERDELKRNEANERESKSSKYDSWGPIPF